eukprot:g18428.t1
MMKSGVIVVLSALAVANGSPEELQAEIQALRQQLRQQKVLIKEQGDRLLEEEEAQSRRLQFVDAATLSTQVAAWDTTTYNLGGASRFGLRAAEAMDSLWLCLCGALVMFMHAGFAMLETGCCRAKNASNVLMKNLVNVCVGTLGWWLLGWAFVARMEPSAGNITPVSCGSDGCQSTMLSWFFQWAFCTAGATIVSGAVAERVKGPTYAAFAFVMTSFIYPMVVAWTWGGGWLAVFEGVGYMDFAGSGVVHLTGGAAGLAGTIVLGPRKGRFVNPEERGPRDFKA